MPAYRYQRLQHPNEIRILTLLGRSDCQALGGDNTVKCILTHVQLDDVHYDAAGRRPAANGNSERRPRSYEAVSWTWGDNTQLVSLDVKDERSSEWKQVSVRQTLVHVLKRLQREDQPRYLWLDGVCIDQRHDHEKDEQVAMMAGIYGGASSVCIWLGDHKDNSEMAIQFITNRLSDLAAFDDTTTDPTFSEEWKALGALMSRDWFSRRWVVQEIAYARKATVYCGDQKVDWTDFETAVSLFERSAAKISRIFHALPTAEHDRDFFGEVAALGATRLVHAKGNLFRRGDDGHIFEYRYTLSELVTELSTFEAGLAHDMIYAVLSLARDTHDRTRAHDEAEPDQTGTHQTSNGPDAQNASATESMPTPDEQTRARMLPMLNNWRTRARTSDRKVFTVEYNQPFFEVCKQFLTFTIKSAPGHFNLDILCRPWAPLGQINLPSWIPSVAQSAWYMRVAEHAPGRQQPARKNHDPLVCQGTSGNLSRSPYNACRNQRAQPDDWHFGEGERSRSLYVTGFLLDTIDEIEFPSQEGNVPREWFDLAGWQPWDDRFRRVRTLPGEIPNAPPERLWRTLVADRDHNGGNAKVYWPKAFEYAVDHSVAGSGLQAGLLVNRNNTILREFIKRMMAVVWNRRLFKSARLQLLGLAPRKANGGDCVCIIRGCSVPVILRKVGHGPQAYYKFIGESYFHTMMDGKAIEQQELNDLPTETFELR